MTFSIVTQGSKGTVTITNAATGAFTYTPNVNASGSDAFTFKATDTGGLASNVATVTVTNISAPNSAPVAQNDNLPVIEDAAKNGTLLATDAEGDVLVFSMVAQGAKGTVTITNSTTGAFTYIPNPNATGNDSFTFKATDAGGLASGVATVTVTITAVNDAPVAQTPTAVLSVIEDTSKTGTLVATDVDGDALTFAIVSQGTKGVVTLANAATGAFIYTPNLNTNGGDSFTFNVTDADGLASNVATVAITIGTVNDAPIAQSQQSLPVIEDTPKAGTLLATDVDGDPLTFSIVTQCNKGVATLTNAATGAFIYTPNLNTNGNDSFSFKATDAGGRSSNVATVTLVIGAVNDAPVALTPTVPLPVIEGTPRTGTLLASDVDGDALTFSIASQGTKGVVTLTNAATGAFIYTPNLAANGDDSFTFRATDAGGLGSNVATVTLTVTPTQPINTAPQALDAPLSAIEGTATNGVLAATDAEADPLTFGVVTQGTKGSVTITNIATGAFTYIPKVGVSGLDRFTFRARDPGGLASNVATIAVTIIPDPLKGGYNGLALASTPTHASTGGITINVTGGRGLSGKLILGGVPYPIVGRFDASGAAQFGPTLTATKTLVRPARQSSLELSLHLDVSDNSTQKITGTLTEAGALFSTIEADHALFTDAQNPVAPRRNVPAEMLGAYTFIIPPAATGGSALPRGYGWGWMRVAANGSVHGAAILADSAPVTFSTFLAQDGSLPVYIPLYAGTGAICGPIVLSAQTGGATTGAVVWFKAAAAGRAFYPAGWPDGATLDVRGSHFVPPAAGAPGILNVLGLSGTTSVSLLGGNLRADVKLPASISADNITLTPPAAIQGFNFTINPANGVFRGRFVDPASKQPRQFRGVLLQNQSEAAGFFLGTTESGAIDIASGTTN